MDSLLLALIVLSAQLLVIVGVAALAEALGIVMDPRFRLSYWRGVALACLALPLSAFAGPETSWSRNRSVRIVIRIQIQITKKNTERTVSNASPRPKSAISTVDPLS